MVRPESHGSGSGRLNTFKRGSSSRSSGRQTYISARGQQSTLPEATLTGLNACDNKFRLSPRRSRDFMQKMVTPSARARRGAHMKLLPIVHPPTLVVDTLVTILGLPCNHLREKPRPCGRAYLGHSRHVGCGVFARSSLCSD